MAGSKPQVPWMAHYPVLVFPEGLFHIHRGTWRVVTSQMDTIRRYFEKIFSWDIPPIRRPFRWALLGSAQQLWCLHLPVFGRETKLAMASSAMTLTLKLWKYKGIHFLCTHLQKSRYTIFCMMMKFVLTKRPTLSISQKNPRKTVILVPKDPSIESRRSQLPSKRYSP